MSYSYQSRNVLFYEAEEAIIPLGFQEGMYEIYDAKSTGMISDLVKKLNLRAFSFNKMMAGQYLAPDYYSPFSPVEGRLNIQKNVTLHSLIEDFGLVAQGLLK